MTFQTKLLSQTLREIKKVRHSGESRNPVSLLIGELAESNKMIELQTEPRK